MKVRYIKDHVDEYGHDFPNGSVTQHSDSIAKARIDAGLCVEAPAGARLFRTDPIAKPMTVCAPPPEQTVKEIPEPEPEQKIFKRKNK